MRPTLSDVAKLAGVSVATASRALSNPDLVADGTRRAVRDAAASCGYKINLVARSLRIQRTDTLLVLTPCIDNAFYPGLVRSIEDTALAMGYAIIVGFTRKSEKYREAYGELLSAGRVDGMVVVDGGSGVERFTGPQPDLPVVQVFDRIYDAPVPVVRVDDHHVADLAVHQLASMGHRRIAHISGDVGQHSARERRDGYRAAMAKLGLPVEDHLVRNGTGHRDGGAEAMRQLLDMAQPPTAVFCANDTMACAAMDVCRDRGIHVPGDISFIGADGTPDGQHAYPSLTTVDVPRAEAGTRAVEKLVGLIRGQAVAPDTVLPVELKLRGSCAPTRTAVAA
ncbi:LacI family transcriptional regulator [Aestuariivirga litoralis]|uniref:LacI family transcriptional regulator n=1 Tax=Aestuariivirga litoralis TaxID=2650924 RepID=A0A2W2BAB7_9HYPH|nr:LacI family DNA-binding transcriptional regulator [Aestuariivirga litoralis]PZF77224.1 LacI family transcriptional regulator [Aestuariivirga litoralis]